MKNYQFTFYVLLLSLFLVSCGDDDSNDGNVDNFDRAAMLENWADNIIVPGYTSYVSALNTLVLQKDDFILNQDAQGLNDLKEAWLDAYLAFQRVSMFEIGRAEQITLRDFSNIFPTDAAEIEDNILLGGYNLQLPSTRDQQGFPALDYLLFGMGSEQETLAIFQNNEAYRNYLNDLVVRLNALGNEVLNDWNSGYRDEFVANSGSEASSSVNKLVNDYMFYYEKALRAGKLGIPAGVFSGNPLSDKVEGLYSRTYSKELYLEALDATIDFFNGTPANSTQNGESLKSYLDFLNTIIEGENLSSLINNQFDVAMNASESLGDDFYNQVETNNSIMLTNYDALQANVILLKVDMFQALNIRVDFVDADGD